MINCVVRTYRCAIHPMGDLEEKLNDGWTVKFSTPIVNNGIIEQIEYILERHKRPEKVEYNIIKEKNNEIKIMDTGWYCYNFRF